MDEREHQAFVKLVRAAGVGGALLGGCILGPLIGLIPNHGLRGFTFVELGLGGIVLVAVVARGLAAQARTDSNSAPKGRESDA